MVMIGVKEEMMRDGKKKGRETHAVILSLLIKMADARDLLKNGGETRRRAGGRPPLVPQEGTPAPPSFPPAPLPVGPASGTAVPLQAMGQSLSREQLGLWGRVEWRQDCWHTHSLDNPLDPIALERGFSTVRPAPTYNVRKVS